MKKENSSGESDYPKEWYKSLYDRMENFLRDQYGRSFALWELIEETHVDRFIALQYIRSRDDVKGTLFRKDGYVLRWESHVVPLPPTEEGIVIERIRQLQLLDKLGREARADYYWTQKRGTKRRR